jgi:hypothetical protein
LEMKQLESRQKTRFPTRLMPLITLVTAILALAMSSVAVAKKCEPPPCNPSGGGDGEYLISLTSGPFQFGPAKVSLNKKGTLVGAETILIDRPEGTEEKLAWNEVMSTCGGPLSGDIDYIEVGADDWSVYKNSDTNISINLETIYLPATGPIKKEIQIILRDYEPGGVFLPPGPGNVNSTIFPLGDYVIWGKPKGGKHSGWDTCFHSESDEVDRLFSDPWEFQLEISLP